MGQQDKAGGRTSVRQAAGQGGRQRRKRGMAPPRERLVAFTAGGMTAAVTAITIKMQLWKETADVSLKRLNPPAEAEKEKQIDGVLNASQRRYLIRAWNSSVDRAFGPI